MEKFNKRLTIFINRGKEYLLNLNINPLKRMKRYYIVAYNNRMYKGYRYVNSNLYTFYGAQYWLFENAKRNRYLYDLLDITTNKLYYDYSEMFSDYERVKRLIAITNANYEEPLKQYIFNFKIKWTKLCGEEGISIYFEDLMTMFQFQMDKFRIYAD